MFQVTSARSSDAVLMFVSDPLALHPAHYLPCSTNNTRETQCCCYGKSQSWEILNNLDCQDLPHIHTKILGGVGRKQGIVGWVFRRTPGCLSSSKFSREMCIPLSLFKVFPYSNPRSTSSLWWFIILQKPWGSYLMLQVNSKLCHLMRQTTKGKKSYRYKERENGIFSNWEDK